MKEHALRKKERLMKRRYFRAGVFVSAAVLLTAAMFGTLLVVSGVDPRPLVAALPAFYAPLLLAGVAWLAWTSAAPARGDG